MTVVFEATHENGDLGPDDFDSQLCDDAAFRDLVARCDEALCRGERPAPIGGLNDESCTAFREIQDCLELLNRVAQADLLSAEELLNPTVDAGRGGNTIVWDADAGRSARRPGEAPIRIGGFHVLEALGAGGFGIVYRAWDPRTEREIALKVPRIEALSSAELQQRFELEAKAAARLDHPHIVPVLEAGVDGALPYIASVYYHGPTLAQWLANGRGSASPRDAAQFIEQLARGVAHAHEQGVLHRDIKPGNILLVPKAIGSPRQCLADHIPKLMDFGLAKLATSGDMTKSGAMLGTLRYMPPEQAEGRVGQIGPPADVYSLGAVLYELLAGRPPFEAASDLELLQMIPRNEPSRIRDHQGGVPLDLETIALKCLEKQPARRYATATALAEDLDRYLTGRPILGRRATRRERIIKWCRRNPQLSASLLFAFVALGTVIVSLLASNARIRASRDRLEQQLYASNVRQASEAALLNNPVRAIELIRPYADVKGTNDRREFAWHFLWNSLHKNERRLPVHPSDVYAVAFSADGKLLATACRNGSVRVWEMPSRQVADITYHDTEVTEIAFSADGLFLSTGTNRGEVRLYRTSDWQQALMLPALSDGVSNLLFSPDSDRILVSAGSSIEILDAATGQSMKKFGLPKGTVHSLSLSADGHRLAATDKTKCYVWELTQPDQDPLVLERRPRIFAACFVPGASWIVLGCQNGVIQVCDATRDEAMTNLESEGTVPVSRLVASPDGRWLASCGNNLLQVYEVDGWQRNLIVRNTGGRIWDADFASGRDAIAIADAEGNVIEYPLEPHALPVRSDGGRVLHTFEGPVATAFAIAPDNLSVACGSNTGVIKILDLASGDIRAEFSRKKDAILDLIYTQGGRCLLVAYDKEGVAEIELTSGQETGQLPKFGLTYAAAMSPNGDKLAIALQEERAVAVLHWPQGAEERRFTNLIDVRDLAFCGDSLLIVAAAGQLCAFDLQSGKTLAHAGHHGEDFRDIELLPSGRTMLVAESDYGAGLRETSAARLLSRLVGHNGQVISVAAEYLTGRTVATQGNDDSVRVWDLITGEPLLVLGDVGAHPEAKLQFSSDGKALLALVREGRDKDRLLMWSIQRDQESE